MKITSSAHGVARGPDAPSQDAYRCQDYEGGIIAALADGVGSSREGRAAAARAVAMMVDYYRIRPQAWSARRAMGEFAAQINRVLHQEALQKYATPELVCTLAVIAIEGDRLYGFTVGDSPVYRWRGDTLTLLSAPHTVAEKGMEHVLTRALGLEATVEPTFFESEVENGDLWIVCSDGVSHPLSTEALTALCRRRPSARTLVTTACEAVTLAKGSPDDATAIVLDVVERDWNSGPTRRPLEVLPTLTAQARVDDYTLLKPLQPSGRVWLAQLADGTRHVLKFPPTEAADDEPRRDAFVREMWNASRIKSPDFVHAFIPTIGALRYYVMAYVEAPTLRDILRRGRLQVEETVELGSCLLRASQFLVRHDLVHGDIKPDNILVIRDASTVQFRLLDLGSAVEVFSLTSRAGTPSYLAPERFHGGAISERTELYAIGATLYEALTRVCPYGEIERFQTPRFDTPPRPTPKLNPAVPPWLDCIIQRALCTDLETRYRAFSEMAFELEHPALVTPFHRADAPLLERDPVLFYKLLCLILLSGNLYLLHRLASG
jgi:serine/threonine protein phosphatase PrpC